MVLFNLSVIEECVGNNRILCYIYNSVDELSQKRMIENTSTTAHFLRAEITEILRKIVFLINAPSY